MILLAVKKLQSELQMLKIVERSYAADLNDNNCLCAAAPRLSRVPPQSQSSGRPDIGLSGSSGRRRHPRSSSGQLPATSGQLPASSGPFRAGSGLSPAASAQRPQSFPPAAAIRTAVIVDGRPGGTADGSRWFGDR